MTDPTSRSVLTVELAYPLDHGGHHYEPDTTVELPTDQAKQIVRDGRARWPKTSATSTTDAAVQEASAPAPATDNATGSPAQEGVTGV